MSLTIEERLDMARLSYQEKRYTEAKVMLEGLADAHPESGETWKLLSYTLYGLHQYQAAEKSALSAIDASSSDADCHYAFGLAVAAEGRWGEAVRIFDHVLVLQPNHAYARTGLSDALVHHARQLIAADNYQLAEQELDRAIKLGKGDPRPTIALAEHFLQLQKPQRAAQVVTAAIQNGLKGPELEALSLRLGIHATAGHAQDLKQVRMAVAQATQKQCPRCGLKSPDWLPKCANCGADMHTGKFTTAAAEVKTEWQVIAYKIMAVLWIVLGVIITASSSISMAAMKGTKSESMSSIMILPIMVGLLDILVGIGLLAENETLQFIAKILCYLNLFITAMQLVTALAMGNMGEAAFQFGYLCFVGFMVYLIRFVAGD